VSLENFCGRIALQARAVICPYQLPSETTATKKGDVATAPLIFDID